MAKSLFIRILSTKAEKEFGRLTGAQLTRGILEM
jgi:hypothetical protein